MLNLPLALLAPFARSVTAVGSRVTCNPAPTDTDADYLVLLMPFDDLPEIEALASMDQRLADVHHALKNDGWELGGSRPDNSVLDDRKETCIFNSYTKGEINLILTADHEFHRAFLAATVVCKHLNLLEKADRVRLFQAVLYGNSVEQLPHLLFAQTPAETAFDNMEDLL